MEIFGFILNLYSDQEKMKQKYFLSQSEIISTKYMSIFKLI